MQRRKSVDIVLAFICVLFLIFMMCTIGIRYFTRQILIEKLKINNAFTDIVFCDNRALGDVSEEKKATNEIDFNINWEELYPFEYDTQEKLNEPKNKTIFDYFEKIKDNIVSFELPIETYSTEHLFGYSILTTFSNSYKSYIKWNFTAFDEYNNVLKYGKNYFYGVVSPKDVSESVTSTIKLSNFCNQKNIEFLYVQLPSKISKYEDTDISGATDFSNQNADVFLQKLNEADVNAFDLREIIHKDKLIHHDLFFETDHHWKGETGLWAAGKILDEMNNLGFSTDSAMLSPDRFDYVVYKDWFLGSQGKKVTLAQATPEDISLIYPKNKSEFHYVIPSMGIDEIGDFSVTYMMECINEKNYMGANPYGAYNHADQPLIKIENKLCDNNYNVLIIHNSFANCVIPFMALNIKNIDALDLRSFNGSVESYIKKNTYDIVIVMYPCDTVGTVDYMTHESQFDFR